MNDITLAVSNGTITTTSPQVAEHFGKHHRHVLRAIDNLECSDEFRRANFGQVIAEYKNGKGGTQETRAFTLTRDGFVFLAMGFTGKDAAAWKEKYIAAFNAMERELRGQTAALSHLITPAQQNALQQIVARRAGDSGGLRAYFWSRFNNHFQLGSYKQLPATRFDEATAYLETVPKKGDPALLDTRMTPAEYLELLTLRGKIIVDADIINTISAATKRLEVLQ